MWRLSDISGTVCSLRGIPKLLLERRRDDPVEQLGALNFSLIEVVFLPESRKFRHWFVCVSKLGHW